MCVWVLTLVPLLYHIHLSATGVSRPEIQHIHAKSWSGEIQVSGLAGGPSFAGVIPIYTQS